MNNEESNKLGIPGSPEERRQFIKEDLYRQIPAVHSALSHYYQGSLSWAETIEYLVCYLAIENKQQQEQILNLLHSRPVETES